MTPAQRIEAVNVAKLTDAQRRSMLNYLLGSLAVLTENPAPDKIAYAVERAHLFGTLQK